MAHTGLEIADMLGELLVDSGHIVWPKDTVLFPAITEAQNTIIFLRPDANPKTVVLALAQTVGQTIPADGVRFLNLTRNIGGKAIRKVDRDALNELIPGWTIETTDSRVEHYVFDLENPMAFSVYPTPSVGTLQAELVYAAKGTAIVSDAGTLSIADTFLAPMLEWVLYRCLIAPTSGQNAALAMQHNANFFNLLGLKRQNDIDIIQKVKA